MYHGSCSWVLNEWRVDLAVSQAAATCFGWWIDTRVAFTPQVYAKQPAIMTHPNPTRLTLFPWLFNFKCQFSTSPIKPAQLWSWFNLGPSFSLTFFGWLCLRGVTATMAALWWRVIQGWLSYQANRQLTRSTWTVNAWLNFVGIARPNLKLAFTASWFKI